jgi:hypothetical protein
VYLKVVPSPVPSTKDTPVIFVSMVQQAEMYSAICMEGSNDFTINH